ncbi:unnamed protein product [Ambrosiozyma monospora]|uniref:Unnamed protein product n=1 Tax=Ambrosiozyma monospora TaxID=43982 RepID=A0ACB5SUM4_AMBMO|nr:unnamed protein product [Ambrosiozyma monospora]
MKLVRRIVQTAPHGRVSNVRWNTRDTQSSRTSWKSVPSTNGNVGVKSSWVEVQTLFLLNEQWNDGTSRQSEFSVTNGSKNSSTNDRVSSNTNNIVFIRVEDII